MATLKPPERIWIDWPRKQADDTWFWTHSEYGNIEYTRAPSPSEAEARAQAVVADVFGIESGLDIAPEFYKPLVDRIAQALRGEGE